MDCKKRQKEVYKGTPQTRCISKKSQNYLEIVDDRMCGVCPVREARKRQNAPCRERPIPVVDKQLITINTHEGYPPCPFRFEGASDLMCSITELPVTPEICHRCEAETREQEATFGDKLRGYFGAIRRWVAGGRPTRSQEEIDRIFKEHCGNGCRRYDPDTNSCKNCGCAVSTTSTPLKNKLAMATETCPLGRF